VVSVLEKGDFFSEARQALRRALELEPWYTPAHLALGRFLVMTAYRNGGTPMPGMRHLHHVIERLPATSHGPEAALLAQAHFYLGMGYRTMGNESQAMACFNTALTHLPTFQPALLARQG
jgi:Tfp pilus assembly protein PilF